MEDTLMHQTVLRLELWQGNHSDSFYLVDPKDSRYWDCKTIYMPTHDYMSCIVREKTPITCIYNNLKSCLTYVGEVLFNMDSTGSVQLAQPTIQGNLMGETNFLNGKDINLEPPSMQPDIGESIAAMNERLSEQGQESERYVSDGGSSDYYKLRIKVDADKVTRLSLNVMEVELETGDVIRALVGNDFNLGNVVKALRRIYECEAGRGKKGVDIAYDLKKIKYFLDDWDAARKRESDRPSKP